MERLHRVGTAESNLDLAGDPPPLSLSRSLARSLARSHRSHLSSLADADSPGTPLNSGSRVHAWVRIAPGAPTGNDLHDAIMVRSEQSEEATVVFLQDSMGRRQTSATVDGVVTDVEQVRSVDDDLIKPLADHIGACARVRVCMTSLSCARALSLSWPLPSPSLLPSPP